MVTKIGVLYRPPNGEPRSIEVEAEVFGPYWAVHPDIDEVKAASGPGWTVTHLPTGLAAVERGSSRSQAQQLANLLVAQGERWNFLEFENENHRSSLAHFLQIAKNAVDWSEIE